MSDGIQNFDIVVVHDGGSLRVSQVIDGKLNPIEGPYHRAEAEARALALAEEHDSDAWIQWGPGDVYTLLSD